AGHADGAAFGLLHRQDQLEQAALAGPRGAHQQRELAPVDPQADVGQRRSGGATVGLGHARELDDRGHGAAIGRSMADRGPEIFGAELRLDHSSTSVVSIAVDWPSAAIVIGWFGSETASPSPGNRLVARF